MTTPSKNAEQPVFQFSLRSTLVLITIIGAILAVCTPPGLYMARINRHYTAVNIVQDKIKSLHFRRPADVPDWQWREAVNRTSQAIGEVYFSPNTGDIVSLERISIGLDDKLSGKVHLGVLRWVWEQCERADGPGRSYTYRFRDVRLLTTGEIDDERLPKLWSLSECSRLDLSNTAVTDAGMVHLNGKRFFSLTLSGTRVGDDGLEQVRGCDRLVGLYLSKTDITDAGMVHVASLRKLKRLGLSDTRVSGIGVKQLAGVRALETLWLQRTRIDDNALRSLERLPLRQLHLDGTQITDVGMESLARIPSIVHLHLFDTQIGDSGVAHLSRLPNLVSLDLARTKVTDEGLKHLSGHQKLRTLMLSDTAVSDAGMKHLTSNSTLRTVYVKGTDVTPMIERTSNGTRLRDSSYVFRRLANCFNSSESITWACSPCPSQTLQLQIRYVAFGLAAAREMRH